MLKVTASGCIVSLLLLGWAVSPAQQPAQKALPAPVPPKAALKTLNVYPAQINLNGPRTEQRIGVLGEYADGRSWDLGRSA
ncbi:MAG TPA: hypothetical protein VKE98_05555, partial [Gemmataceae bacterium]|nr:hypothetical protein [Gemmataceae bacterium]